MRSRLDFTFFYIAIVAVGRVVAHGWVQNITIGSTVYPGYHPFVDPYTTPPAERIMRRVAWNGPIEDMSLIDIQCSGWTAENILGSAPAPLVAPIAPGDTITYNWGNWPSGHRGPVSVYMARAPDNVDITVWEPGTESVWFKTQHAGKREDGIWASNENVTIHTATIPRNLRPGQYIVRHELIALHQAEIYPGAQAYPNCIQVELTGDGTAFPTSFVSIPGAYSAQTPGIVWNLWNGTDDLPYPIPGPEVWTPEA